MRDAMKADGAFIGQDVSVTPLIGKLRLHIQGYVVKEDFFISPLKHEDVILGAPWFDRLVDSIKFSERKISFKFREKDMYINAQESGSTIPLVNDQAFDKSIKSSVSAYMIFVKDSLNGVNETQDSTSYQIALIPELEARLRAKNESLALSFVMDEPDSLGINSPKNLPLSERIKVAIEGIELEEAALVEDLYSADRKFAEYYNVLEQILGVLLRIVKDFKLQHQHQYDGLRKSWLCKRCQTMNAKLRVLEHLLLRDTYTQESIPALHMIREHLLGAKEEATAAYNRAVTRLREYQGVDPHFDAIARRYHDLVQKLEGIKWTIRQVEMDLNNPEEHLTM
ncbi:hypothetical protein L7F22_029406 [Adiantum nelumboides]|nr:hypothetical protein [Adiantum nelumboides]